VRHRNLFERTCGHLKRQ